MRILSRANVDFRPLNHDVELEALPTSSLLRVGDVTRRTIVILEQSRDKCSNHIHGCFKVASVPSVHHAANSKITSEFDKTWFVGVTSRIYLENKHSFCEDMVADCVLNMKVWWFRGIFGRGRRTSGMSFFCGDVGRGKLDRLLSWSLFW